MAGNRKGLTREPSREYVNHSLIAVGIPFTGECADIAKDGGFWEDSVVDPEPDDLLAFFIVLNVPHGREPEQVRPQQATAGASEKREFAHQPVCT